MLTTRSELLRWCEVTLGLYLAVVFSPLGPDAWRDTPSLRWLHAILPWTLLLVLLVAYVVLVAVGQAWAYVLGSALGVVLYGWEFVALFVTLHLNAPSNPFVFAAMTLAVLLHIRQVTIGVDRLARR